MNYYRHQPIISREQGGFTLVEIVIIIVLVGLLSGVFLFSDSGTEEITLRADAEQLASDIRYAQNLGMTKGARYRINFSNACASGSACYWISNQNDTIKIPNPRTNTDEVALSNNISLSTNQSAVIFNGKGIPFSSTNSILTGNVVVILSISGGVPKTISISPETGRVIVQ